MTAPKAKGPTFTLYNSFSCLFHGHVLTGFKRRSGKYFKRTRRMLTMNGLAFLSRAMSASAFEILETLLKLSL
jgi:hypothetical protein